MGSGTVGNVCSLTGASGYICSAGVCQASGCLTGYGLYSGSCKNLATDGANCGTLGNVCQFPGGTGVCSAGKCTLTGCGNGYYAIGGKCVQLYLQTDPLNWYVPTPSPLGGYDPFPLKGRPYAVMC